MRQEVNIRIKDVEAESDMKVDGIYMEKDNKHYLFYETPEGKSRIEISPDVASIRHAGGLAETLLVRLFKEEAFDVSTPMGVLHLATFGKEISMILSDTRKYFTLSYDLLESSEVVDSHKVTIDAKVK